MRSIHILLSVALLTLVACERGATPEPADTAPVDAAAERRGTATAFGSGRDDLTPEEHYGIHGTRAPETIGYATSSGCVRLTNWDAAFLARRVAEGVRVEFTDVAGRGG